MAAGPTILDTPWNGTSYSPPVALDVNTLESAITAQLQAAAAETGNPLGQIEIVQFPDKPAAYRMTHRVGAALIGYRGAKYGALDDTGAVVQERTLTFGVNLMVRALGWSLGAGGAGQSPGGYALLDAVRAALTGFAPPGCRKMYPLRERFAGRDPQGGVWTWSIDFALDTMAVEPSTAPNYPVFIKGVALDAGAQTTAVAAGASYIFNAQGQVVLAAGNVSAVSVAPSGGGAPFVEGVDYSVDAVNGIVQLLPGGAIAAGAVALISYAYADSVVAIAGSTDAPTAPSN